MVYIFPQIPENPLSLCTCYRVYRQTNGGENAGLILLGQSVAEEARTVKNNDFGGGGGR